MDSFQKLAIITLFIPAGADIMSGCAHGPLVSREVLSDRIMQFTSSNPIEPQKKSARDPDHPLPPNTVWTHIDYANQPGEHIQGSHFDSSLRVAAEVWSGLGLEAGYGARIHSQLVQKLDGFLGPIRDKRTFHGPDAALVLDDGSSVLRLGYRYRTAWDGVLHEPSIRARSSVLTRDTILEVGYRRSMSSLLVSDHHLPAKDPIDDSRRADRFFAAMEQGFLPGWNLRLDATILLEDGFLQSPYRLVSLWSHRDLTNPSDSTSVPRTQPENHPDSRVRWGLILRIRRFLPALSSVLELGSGYGSGSWRVEHSVLHIAYLQRLGDLFVLSFQAGGFHQTRASFYRDDYNLPPPGAYWSADRELSSYVAWWSETTFDWLILEY